MNTVAASDTFMAKAGHSYRFYSRARDVAGNIEVAPASPDAQYTSSVAVGEGVEARLELAGARPNPARGAVNVWFTLGSGEAALELFDVSGRRVTRRAVGTMGAGEHVVTLGVTPELRAGLYFVRLSQAGQELHARVALMR